MLWLILLSVLAQPLVVAPQRLAVSQLKSSDLDERTVSMLTSMLAEALARNPRYSVRDRDDLNALLQHEKEAELAGCNDPTCYTDITRFLGADGMVAGKVGKVGDEFVITASLIQTDGVVRSRATARAKRLEDLGREIAVLAIELQRETGATASGAANAPGTASSSSAPLGTAGGAVQSIVPLRNHDDCHWAAVHDIRLDNTHATSARLIYQATFAADHFRFGRYLPLDGALLIEPHFDFLGEFHSCFAREAPDIDAFSLEKGRVLAVKASQAEAATLRRRWRERSIEVVVRFEITGGELTPSRPYDWENCEGEARRPFKSSDITPKVTIKPTAARCTKVGDADALAVFVGEPDNPLTDKLPTIE